MPKPNRRRSRPAVKNWNPGFLDNLFQGFAGSVSPGAARAQLFSLVEDDELWEALERAADLTKQRDGILKEAIARYRDARAHVVPARSKRRR